MRVETRNLKTIAQCIECRARMLADGVMVHWPECSLYGIEIHYAAGAIHQSAAWCPTRTMCGRTVTPLNYYDTTADADRWTGGRLASHACKQCFDKIDEGKG